MLRYGYTLLFYLMLPFIFLRLWWRSRSRNNPEYKKRWAERLGYCPHTLSQSLWIHAVSVGETLAAVPLIKALKTRYPTLPIILTNMTPTGSARAKVALGDSVLHSYIPYDLPDAVNRFLKKINPVCAIIIETELWPNLFLSCKKRAIPIVIANARLSKKSAGGYRKILSNTTDMLTAVTRVAAQSKADANRFIQLGIDKEKITVTGNLKFDLELPCHLLSERDALRQPFGENRLLWIAASTHQGEEEIIFAAHHLIFKKMPNALLLIAPRHPERFDRVFELAKQNHFSVVRRSANVFCGPDITVYLSDTMGELLRMYSICDVAFVGGSFAPVGGHNMVEPAVLSKPILTGPHVFNFAEISDMLFKANGMMQVNNAEELADHVIHLFEEADYRKKIGENAFRVVEANRGALNRQLQLIDETISHS